MTVDPHQPVCIPVRVKRGAKLKRGAVLGRISVGASKGRYCLSVAGAADGSSHPVAILAEDCDARSRDKQSLAYIAGRFTASALQLGKGHSVAALIARLRLTQPLIVVCRVGVRTAR